jgi:N4-gp56 family major capsid protein
MAVANFPQQNWPNASANPQYLALKELLDTAPAYECIMDACDERTVQRQMGANVNLRRYFTPAVDATPAPEGVQKEPRALQFEDFAGTMLRYTERFQITRYDYDLNPYNAVKAGQDRLRQLIISTRERVRWNAALTLANVIYNSTAVSAVNQVNGPVQPGRLQVIIRAIRNAKGEVFDQTVPGVNKEGTSPTEACYNVYSHTDLEPDWRAFPDFQTCAETPSGKAKSLCHFGNWQNACVYTTPEAIVQKGAGAATTTMLATAGAADVYPVIVLARHAITAIKLAGEGKKGFGNLGIQVLDEADKFDPNNNWIDVVASWYDLAMVTSNDWGYVWYVAATANPG